MKLRFVLILFLAGFFMSCNDYIKVFNDFNLHSYYVSINISYKDKIFPIVIENTELYDIIADNTLSTKQYIKKMVSLIENNKALVVDDKMYNKLENFIIDSSLCQVLSLGKKGKEYCLDYYFKESILKKDISNEEEKCLIHELFNWGIFLKTDDESGYIIIDMKN